jgi:CRP/FNR family transcriptional regulator, polysaccharide utilization system transcription regulator
MPTRSKERIHTDCETCGARHGSVFCDLPETQLQAMTARKGCKTFSRGEMIFYAGDTPNDLFCVQKGLVKIYRVGSDGREQIVRLAHAGDIVGYRSLISGDHYAAFAAALDEVEVCHIPKSLFLSLLSQTNNLAANVLSLLATELKSAEERIVDMAQKPVRERLAETLLLLKTTYGVESDEMTLKIRLTRIESVSRMLSSMKEEGMIAMSGRKIRITDHAAVLEAANVAD